MPRTKKAVKRVPKKKPAVRRKAARPAPPTVEGVFHLVFTKRSFLPALAADMDGALTKARLNLPPGERAKLKTMLETTYSVTGMQALTIIRDWFTKKVPPPPPPWGIPEEPQIPVI